MKVGSITVINLTGNLMDIYVNSNKKKHTIAELHKGRITFEESEQSPVEGEEFGYKPSSMIFLRSEETEPNHFGQDINKITIDTAGEKREFDVSIGKHAIQTSATLTVTPDSFIIASPDDEIWAKELRN
ncbi:MAG: hypothetical protein HRT38_02550 [Alteromonadaceae bacterium]|nr:hypothetical protein [Alteromonadaceae bacterium]